MRNRGRPAEVLLGGARLVRRNIFGFAILACAAVAFSFPSLFDVWCGVKLMSLIVPTIQLIMFGMGTTLSVDDFMGVARMPIPVLIGVFLQFLVMPAAGFLLAVLFGFSGELAAGLVLVGSVAGGTASNVVAYLARANVALSVTMTCISTLLSPLLTPLLMKFYAGQFISIDVLAMMVEMLKVVIVPVAAGGIVHRIFARQFSEHKVVCDRVLSFVSMSGICFTILVLTAPSRAKFAEAGLLIIFAAMLHNSLGYASGYWLTRLAGRFLRLGETEARTVAIEVGMQNGGMAGALAVGVLNSPVAALPASVFSIWMNFSGSVLASFWSRRRIGVISAVLIGMFASCAAAEVPRVLTDVHGFRTAPTAREGETPKFMVGAYRFVPRLRSEAAFRDMKEAGIDFIIDDFHRDTASLDALRRVGIGAISSNVLPGEWGGHTNVNGRLASVLPLSRFEQAARSLKPHPAEIMFCAGDENSALDFPHLGRAFRRVKELAPQAEIYHNIHSSTVTRPEVYFGVDNFQRYVEEYCRHIPLGYISYDLYMYGRPRDWGAARFYESFRVVADACRDTHRSLWFVPQVNTTRPEIDITAQKLRHQAYAAMAFGAERLTWACWTPGWWTNNVLTASGEKTAQYARLKTVNLELRRLAPEYMRFIRTETHFTGFTGAAAKWIAPDTRGRHPVPQVNFNLPDGIDTALFAGVKGDDDLPLVVGDMAARDGSARRALFVFAADDPYDESPRMRTVRFRPSCGSFRAVGPDGPLAISREQDGACTFALHSSSAVMLIGEP